MLLENTALLTRLSGLLDDVSNPVCIDLYCGLGGWAQGFLAEGWRVIGFDIETRPYPGQLVIQDVLTLHGAQFRHAAAIVASPPCQKYSYMAMPWKRAKELAAWYRADPARIIELNALFDACFRIQREASEAAGHHIPMVVENVKGAQPWVGRARWHYGSFYLWGDVPALMPFARASAKVPGLNWNGSDKPGYVARAFNTTADQRLRDATKNNGGGWFNQAHNTESGHGQNPDGRKIPASCAERRWEDRPVKRLRDVPVKGDGDGWFTRDENGKRTRADVSSRFNSKSQRRSDASAEIAKIPFPLAQHIAACFKPTVASLRECGCREVRA